MDCKHAATARKAHRAIEVAHPGRLYDGKLRRGERVRVRAPA